MGGRRSLKGRADDPYSEKKLSLGECQAVRTFARKGSETMGTALNTKGETFKASLKLFASMLQRTESGFSVFQMMIFKLIECIKLRLPDVAIDFVVGARPTWRAAVRSSRFETASSGSARKGTAWASAQTTAIWARSCRRLVGRVSSAAL
jgi:hypothetical protein